jgi:hypothetical protein
MVFLGLVFDHPQVAEDDSSVSRVSLSPDGT